MEWARNWAESHPREHIAIIGETKGDVRDVLIEKGESSLLEISPPWFKPRYEPSKRRVTWPNGAYGTLYSGDEPAQLRGPQHNAAIVDELAKYRYPQETWDMLEFGLRAGEDCHVVVATTPRPIPIIRQLIKDPETVTTTGSTYENLHNLAAGFIARVVKRYEGTTLGRQELHAEILEDDPKALWQRATMIEPHRRIRKPQLERIVIGVDPHTSSEGVGETGIIAAGLDARGHGYILEDLTTGGRPETWAKQAIAAYHKYGANQVIAEKNQGGDMVETTMRTIPAGGDVAIKLVWASHGKQARAEPISAFYEQGRVHHIGLLGPLEDELCTWVPGTGSSPNRLDALVWALTDLMLEVPAVVQVKENPFYA
jgi:phage terminase large subunit-like protein